MILQVVMVPKEIGQLPDMHHGNPFETVAFENGTIFAYKLKPDEKGL